MRIAVDLHQEEIKTFARPLIGPPLSSPYKRPLISQSNSYAAAPTLRAREQSASAKSIRDNAMADILLENIKLVVLFILIAAVIGMSHFGMASTARRKTPGHSSTAALANR
jgi:hypothetical protein